MSSVSKYSSEQIIALDHTHGAHNYHPLPIVFSRGLGPYVWDPEGKQYLDFLSAYSATNQGILNVTQVSKSLFRFPSSHLGHCHPKIIEALTTQAQKLCLSSRAFYNDIFGIFAKKITELFGFDMVLPMNTGAEGVETAMKLARKCKFIIYHRGIHEEGNRKG